MKKARPTTKDVDVAQLEGLLARIEGTVTQEDHALVAALVSTLLEVHRLLRRERATVARLRGLLGITSSEKTAKVLGDGATRGGAPDGQGADDATITSPTVEPPTDATSTEESATSGDASSGANATSDTAPRAPGHGRIACAAYVAECTPVPHERLHAGQTCPDCEHGKLHVHPPAPVLRLFGQPSLAARRWDLECLRCGGCGCLFTAQPPVEAQGPKCSESATGALIVHHYGMGVPFHRLAQVQKCFGVPLPASTQWEAVRDALPAVMPAYLALAELAANADVLLNDDTHVKILGLMGKRRAKLVDAEGLERPDRTGLFTTSIIARTAVGLIALFASGRQHAGENLSDLLNLRACGAPLPVHMCDGLDHNRSDDHDVIECNCLAHARRHIVDQIDNHRDLCAHALREIGTVFKNDETCRARRMSDQERLAHHQRESAHIIEGLRSWMLALLAKEVEPNSGLGQAFTYFLKRWTTLTAFLRVPGAPIDNNPSERGVKRAIRLRNASLFYRSLSSAHVGDIYMALIYTTELHGSDPFRYITALLTHHKAVAEHPHDWLPWNYDSALAQLTAPVAAAA